MIGKPEHAVGGEFVTKRLPWLVGAAGLLIYLCSLNPWVSLASLRTMTRVSGWSWQPQLDQPLTTAILYPFTFLPESWTPLALNLFAAGCAGLALMLLARSVALLPHDTKQALPGAVAVSNPASLLTHHAWIPPVLAAIVCGLQISFWEQATSFAGEMIDLLVFAYVVRCILEFRLSQDERWLRWSACVYGAGMANNWGMIGYLPLFLAALFVAKHGGDFFDRWFLVRMALCGLAGLSLDLLLPALHQFSSSDHVGFWAALKAHLKAQKDGLMLMRRPAIRLLALASLLPLLVLSIRWKSHTVQFGDDTRVGVFLTKATVHFLHALFLVVALWMALDPKFSPRHVGLGMPMLSYYYLSAMVAGYCAGHFLLMGSAEPTAGQGCASEPQSTNWPRSRHVKRGLTQICFAFGRRALHWLVLHRARLATSLVGALLCAMPVMLTSRNLGHIKVTNGPVLRQFSRQLYADLPAGKSVALSDEPEHLGLLQAELSAHGHDKDVLPLDTHSLMSARYQILMASRYNSRWPMAPPTNATEMISPMKLQELASGFAAREPIVYLHPSSGLFFEQFVDEPHGTIHILRPGLPDQLPADALVATNEAIWQERWRQDLGALAHQTRKPTEIGPEWSHRLLHALRLGPELNATISFLVAANSKSLDYWGVVLQRQNRWQEAAVWFERAVSLNPNNLAARINSLYNGRHLRGDKTRLQAAEVQKQFQDVVAGYTDWRQVLNDGGPVDEPTFLLRSGRAYWMGGHTRQAMRDFARCAALAPDWLEPKMRLALCAAGLGDFAGALGYADQIEAEAQSQGGPILSRLLFCRTTALRGLGRTNDAAACIEKFIAIHQQESDLLAVAAVMYEGNRLFREALMILSQAIKQQPGDPKLLAMKGWAELELGQYAAAQTSLTAALALAPADDTARLHRGIAYLGAGRLDEARADYEALLQRARNTQVALFGLGAVAWRKRDTNAAIDFYRQYLSNGIPASVQYALAAERLRQLER